MATALQKQLAAIAANSTHQLDLKAQKSAHGKSLLFEPRVASSQSFDNLYLICHDGFRDLCALDSRFLHFSKSLFSEQSKVEDRTKMTSKENEKLDAVLEAFLTLVGPKLLLKPAMKAVEWLVRRFKVHEYNTECLTFTFLPYHNTPQFLALLTILPHPPISLRFLAPYISSPTNPPRRTITYTAINTPALFDGLQSHVVKVLNAGHQDAQLLSFWSSITGEAILGILNNASSGRKDVQDQKTEELVLRILPTLNSCMRAKHGAETVTACYTIVVLMVHQGNLGDKILDSLLEAVIMAHDETTLNECLASMALIANERSRIDLPGNVTKRLLRIPEVTKKLQLVAGQCQSGRLVLGCAIGALRSSGSDERRKRFHELMDAQLLTAAQNRTVMTVLLNMLRDSPSDSEEQGRLIEIATKLAESKDYSHIISEVAKTDGMDLEAIGVSVESGIEIEELEALDLEDDDAMDVDDATKEPFSMDIPKIESKSFLLRQVDDNLAELASSLEHASAAGHIKKFLASTIPSGENAAKQAAYISFLIRVWCSNRPVPVRVAAVRAAGSILVSSNAANLVQDAVPYMIYSLADPAPLVRRAAASCIVSLSKKSDGLSKSKAASSLYGLKPSSTSDLSNDDLKALLSSALVPILEECIMDSGFVIGALRDMLEGNQSAKSTSTSPLKVPQRTTLLSFFAFHLSHTPVLRVRLCLLPLFKFTGKISDPVRSNSVLPVVKQWCALSAADAAKQCEYEGITLIDAEKQHLEILLPKDTKSVHLLQEILSLESVKERTELVQSLFDHIKSIWPSLKSEPRLALAQSMLGLALEDTSANDLRRASASETLRNVRLDSAILVTFLNSVPSALQMPEGPPATKRRRTSRNEMVRVDSISQENVQKLLHTLTFILELIEASDPAQHPALFKSLFGVYGDLQALKQQSDSELVYLQSIILSSLAPIVNTLKGRPDASEYHSAIRADLLIESIRNSTSPQVQNSALLLIANLASWVPELILHNLMPVFTFIGSTLLRQQDDYSAQVVDKTISRVVPQLAASLRAKHKNFLTGVSDLLLSFTAAFEHIPQHRRLKLFSELARTLGPADSLPAILALLADRCHGSKEQQRFSTDLLLTFDPANTLDAFHGYLELIVDATKKPRKVSDTLFALHEKQPAQIESTLKTLLSSLADLAADDRLRRHVAKAFRQSSDSNRSREVFASTMEVVIQLSEKMASSPKQYALCGRVLARCLDLLPTVDLVRSAELLLSKSDARVQVAAIKAVQLRVATTVQNDEASVLSLLSFLHSVDHVLQTSQAADTKAVAVDCIDRIIERFGKRDVATVASVSQTISSSHSLASSDDKVRALSLLCLTSIVDVLEDEAISLLPTVLPTAFEYLKLATNEERTLLHNAVWTLLTKIVEQLGYMFSGDYMASALDASLASAVGGLDDTCDDSRGSFLQAVSQNIDAFEIFTALKATVPAAASQGPEALLEQLELLRSTINHQTKSALIKARTPLFSLLLQAFNLRQAIDSSEEEAYDDDTIIQLEDSLTESVITMVLKLSDATFRPFFVQLVDQYGPLPSEPIHAAPFYRFLAAFFDKFKSIVTSYSSYLIEHIAKVLAYCASEDADADLRTTVLEALQRMFQHDQDSFWQAPSHFTTILEPLLNLLALPASTNATESVIFTIADLATACASSTESHKAMNAILLRNMRSDDAQTRLATVLCEQALTERLGEEWLGLLPEMLPFISELREDDDEMVERETQRWISGMEGVLGESLEGMLQ